MNSVQSIYGVLPIMILNPENKSSIAIAGDRLSTRHLDARAFLDYLERRLEALDPSGRVLNACLLVLAIFVLGVCCIYVDAYTSSHGYEHSIKQATQCLMHGHSTEKPEGHPMLAMIQRLDESDCEFALLRVIDAYECDRALDVVRQHALYVLQRDGRVVVEYSCTDMQYCIESLQRDPAYRYCCPYRDGWFMYEDAVPFEGSLQWQHVYRCNVTTADYAYLCDVHNQGRWLESSCDTLVAYDESSADSVVRTCMQERGFMTLEIFFGLLKYACLDCYRMISTLRCILACIACACVVVVCRAYCKYTPLAIHIIMLAPMCVGLLVLYAFRLRLLNSLVGLLIEVLAYTQIIWAYFAFFSIVVVPIVELTIRRAVRNHKP